MKIFICGSPQETKEISEKLTNIWKDEFPETRDLFDNEEKGGLNDGVVIADIGKYRLLSRGEKEAKISEFHHRILMSDKDNVADDADTEFNIILPGTKYAPETVAAVIHLLTHT